MKSCSFPPSFHFKKCLAKFTIGVRPIYGFRQKGTFGAKSGCVLYSDATYTRVYTVDNIIENYKSAAPDFIFIKI